MRSQWFYCSIMHLSQETNLWIILSRPAQPQQNSNSFCKLTLFLNLCPEQVIGLWFLNRVLLKFSPLNAAGVLCRKRKTKLESNSAAHCNIKNLMAFTSWKTHQITTSKSGLIFLHNGTQRNIIQYMSSSVQNHGSLKRIDLKRSAE